MPLYGVHRCGPAFEKEATPDYCSRAGTSPFSTPATPNGIGPPHEPDPHGKGRCSVPGLHDGRLPLNWAMFRHLRERYVAVRVAVPVAVAVPVRAVPLDSGCMPSRLPKRRAGVATRTTLSSDTRNRGTDPLATRNPTPVRFPRHGRWRGCPRLVHGAGPLAKEALWARGGQPHVDVGVETSAYVARRAWWILGSQGKLVERRSGPRCRRPFGLADAPDLKAVRRLTEEPLMDVRVPRGFGSGPRRRRR